jgi:hypothetical protein
MARIANPTRTQQICDRLSAYYADDPLNVYVKSLPRQGLFIAVSHEGQTEVGILFHVDQVDNGASGFKDEALRKINAFRDGVAYVPRAPKGLVYDDIMTYGSPEAINGLE